MKNVYILLLLSFGLSQDYSLEFDGNDYVTIPKLGTLNMEGTSEFTIQMYINNDALPGSPTWRYLISNTGTISGSGIPGGYLLRYGGDGGAGPYNYQFYFQTSSTNGVNASENMAYESWQNLSIVYKNNTLEYFQDGNSLGSQIVSGDFFDDYEGEFVNSRKLMLIK